MKSIFGQFVSEIIREVLNETIPSLRTDVFILTEDGSSLTDENGDNIIL